MERKKRIPINGTAKNFTHEELTAGIVEALTDDLDASVIKIPVKADPKSNNLFFNYKSLLKQLKKINKDDNKLDYLNISTACMIPYEDVGLSASGKELADPNVLNAVKQKILNNSSDLQVPEQIPHIIEELERISKEGTNIYISAGNRSNSFNAFSLAKDTHTIGGCEVSSGMPINRLSSNPLVESYEALPIYTYMHKKAVKQEGGGSNFLSMQGLIPTETSIGKLSKTELIKKIATKDDYSKLKARVDELWNSGKYKFDFDFLKYELVQKTNKDFHNKIYDINKYLEIFKDKFDAEVLKYTFPQGTHCDLTFCQFFNMKSKNKYTIPLARTTEIPNALSGTSFTAPQALGKAVRKDVAKTLNCFA